jgi:nicotinamide mononucleotide (NMN) deamidase PncC
MNTRPTGGTADKPVGLVFIACATPQGTTVKQHRFGFDRNRIQMLACYEALRLLGEHL